MSESVGTFKTGNITWKVYVKHHGFAAVAPGFADVYGDSWDEMESRAKVAASKAKVKVDVPYVVQSWAGNAHTGRAVLDKRTATGLHAGSGNVLYKDDRGGSGQETSGYGRSGFLKPFSREDESAYLDLVTKRRDLDNQIAELERKYRFPSGGLKTAVEQAINDEHARRQAAGGPDA